MTLAPGIKPGEFTGKLTDPAFRTERARRAALARTTVDAHLDALVYRKLTAAQVQKLRQLLSLHDRPRGGGPDAA